MDQDIGSEAPVDPAAVAFEALRREVALLNVALAGLAAERASAPDYSETLGEIAQGVRVAVGRIGKLATSPALAATPAEIAQQITAAGDEARRQDRATLHQAQEMLQRAAGDLRGWVDTARLASVQNWRLLQVALAGVVGGAVLGASAPAIVTQAAPEAWAWPEKRAARVLHRDIWSAGERLLATADPHQLRELKASRLIIEQNRIALAKCVKAADKAKAEMRCLIRIKTTWRP
uniref:Uncharacterized protein n=1 Tax=Caulobacter sp. (strain K31) TaxID=366602 RepID=B0SXW0_CAUSK